MLFPFSHTLRFCIQMSSPEKVGTTCSQSLVIKGPEELERLHTSKHNLLTKLKKEFRNKKPKLDAEHEKVSLQDVRFRPSSKQGTKSADAGRYAMMVVDEKMITKDVDVHEAEMSQALCRAQGLKFWYLKIDDDRFVIFVQFFENLQKLSPEEVRNCPRLQQKVQEVLNTLYKLKLGQFDLANNMFFDPDTGRVIILDADHVYPTATPPDVMKLLVEPQDWDKLKEEEERLLLTEGFQRETLNPKHSLLSEHFEVIMDEDEVDIPEPHTTSPRESPSPRESSPSPEGLPWMPSVKRSVPGRCNISRKMTFDGY